MADLSTFQSRKGSLECTPSEIYNFVTDIRNLQQFVPRNAGISGLKIESDSCSFNISSMGNVDLRLSEKVPDEKIVFNGTLFQSNDFSLVVDIMKNLSGKADARVTVSSHLNPVLRMMVAGPVQTFLEKMIEEMEKFQGWKNTSK